MNQTTAAEEILEPDLPIIDPHHHLWDVTPLIPGAETYLLTEFLRDVGTGHRIEATVYVEARAMYRADGPERLRPVGEVEFANGVAAMSASGIYGPARICAGIVGYADLRLGDDVTEVLEALCAAGNGRLRGVRNLSATDPDPSIYPHPRPPGLLRDSRFRVGFARLAPLGLSFDAWLHHTQLDEVVDLAREFPRTTIVVDHTGGPLRIGRYASRPEQSYADWKSAVKALAECPNVVLKLGGLGMRYLGMPRREAGGDSSRFLAEQWRPFIETSIEALGTPRCMFESNFPVDGLTCGYATLWNAFKRITTQCSAAEKADLYKNTAARVYRIDAQFPVNGTATLRNSG